MGKWFEIGWQPPPPKLPKIRRFWLPRGSKRRILFVDENPFRFWEHNYYTEELGWRNYEVCTLPLGKCAFCEMNISKSYVGFLTIIDLDGWTDRSGRSHKNEKLLIPLKTEGLEILKIKKEKYGLARCIYEVYRLDTENSKASGDSFEFLEKVDDEKLKELLNVKDEDFQKLLVPFNYEELFKPKPYEIQVEILRKASEVTDLGDLSDLGEVEY